jgi:multisubunit Na+/H+ antiporter MnhC subunit
MTFAIITGLIVFVVVALFLVIARHVLRLAVKLAIVGMLVLLLVAGATYAWWRGWFPPSQADRPASSNRARPTPRRAP